MPRQRTPHAPELDAAAWFKSSYSAGEQACVEVADIRGTLYSAIAVRDSKNPDGPALLITPEAFARFTQDAAQVRYNTP
ncbi:DUF397 domain-containing protein [Streptomyces dysideae]|uniref:DUF397 domain-containing protein n=1 Tax=Streptomyces dysideae TaxID=909626 RepID=A0A101V5Z4_9ACTN|nr:DUF397 domain-containing protein [Streptomyces dysideae]KUO23143.1 hypothetical protein AQJ91_00545 [Streptomyces dysideae]